MGDWNFPLYVAKVHDDLRCEVFAGPFHDIDNALDACWDHGASWDEAAGRTDREFERFFVIEMGGDHPVVRTLPRGAFPTEEVLAEAFG